MTPITNFDTYIHDERLIELIRLSRAASQLLHCSEALQDKSGKTSRQLLNSFLTSCATLYEAVSTFNVLGKLKGYNSYQELSGKLNADPLINNFLDKKAGTFRNQLAFHFDDFASPVLRTQSPYNPSDSAISTIGEEAIDPVDFFDIADAIAFNYLLDKHYPNWEVRNAFANVYDKFIESTNNFLSHTNSLVFEVMTDLEATYPNAKQLYSLLKAQFLGTNTHTAT